MVRISGVNLPNQKRIAVGLTYIYGIGRTLSTRLLTDLNIDPNVRVKDLSENDEKKLRDAIVKITTEGDLRRKVAMDVKRLQDAGTYRGVRHRKKLPCRGQKTKGNARTLRGKKTVGVGSGRRKEAKK